MISKKEAVGVGAGALALGTLGYFAFRPSGWLRPKTNGTSATQTATGSQASGTSGTVTVRPWGNGTQNYPVPQVVSATQVPNSYTPGFGYSVNLVFDMPALVPAYADSSGDVMMYGWKSVNGQWSPFYTLNLGKAPQSAQKKTWQMFFPAGTTTFALSLGGSGAALSGPLSKPFTITVTA
jgi:hypothetical protein